MQFAVLGGVFLFVYNLSKLIVTLAFQFWYVTIPCLLIWYGWVSYVDNEHEDFVNIEMARTVEVDGVSVQSFIPYIKYVALNVYADGASPGAGWPYTGIFLQNNHPTDPIDFVRFKCTFYNAKGFELISQAADAYPIVPGHNLWKQDILHLPGVTLNYGLDLDFDQHINWRGIVDKVDCEPTVIHFFKFKKMDHMVTVNQTVRDGDGRIFVSLTNNMDETITKIRLFCYAYADSRDRPISPLIVVDLRSPGFTNPKYMLPGSTDTFQIMSKMGGMARFPIIDNRYITSASCFLPHEDNIRTGNTFGGNVGGEFIEDIIDVFMMVEPREYLKASWHPTALH